MNPKMIKIQNDVQILHYDQVHDFFADKTMALNVTTNQNESLEINFDIITNFIDGMITQPNLYGLLTSPNGRQWQLRYIGQRKAKGIKQRMYQHLVKKHKNTGAQLEKVKKELNDGKYIGVKLASVTPDELRHYYEEKLLQDIPALDWNVQR